MINAISASSIIESKNRFYTASNIVSTVALFALKEAASLDLTTFTLLGIIIITVNYFIFDSIATSSLSNKKKIIPLQITLLGLIVLGCAGINVVFLSTGYSLSKILYVLIATKFRFHIADLPLYMLIFAIIFSPLKTSFKVANFFKETIIIHNRLLQEFRPLNWVSHERPLIQVKSRDCFQFILYLITEAITRGNRDAIDPNQNTILFEYNRILARHLIIPMNESTQPILNPSRFLEIYEYLQVIPQQVAFEAERGVTFQMLLSEFQKLSVNLQKKYSDQMVQYRDLQWMIPNHLQITLREYQRKNAILATDLDAIITTGVSFNKKILEFAKRQPHLQTLDELKNIMSRYTSLQDSLRENLDRQEEHTNARKRITTLINSLYFSYEKNIVPIRSQFPDDVSDDLDQPAWNLLATKFPRDFFQNLPQHLFSNVQDPNKLDEDFNKYAIGTAQEFITKVFNGDTAAFRGSRKDEVLEKLINYCTNNSPSNKNWLQLLKIQEQSHRIIKISTAIFASIIAPLLVNPIEFGIGSLYAIIFKIRVSPPSIEIKDVPTSLFQGFLLSFHSWGRLWAGLQFGTRYIVPLFSSVVI